MHETGELQGRPTVRSSSSPKNNQPPSLPLHKAEPSPALSPGIADFPLSPPCPLTVARRDVGVPAALKDAAVGDVAMGYHLKVQPFLIFI